MVLTLTFGVCLLLTLAESNAYTIETRACVDNGKPVERHGFCEYSCRVTGLGSGESFTVGKPQATHYSLNGNSSVSGANVIFNTTHGLNPGLPDRYKAKLSSDNSRVTINITDASPEDSGYLTCFISDEEGKKIFQTGLKYIPVLGATIETSFSPSGPEVSLTKEELDGLVFKITVNNTMPVVPKASIVAHYSAVDLMEDVTKNFKRNSLPGLMVINEGGLLNVWEGTKFGNPDDNTFKTNQGKLKLVGTYEYANRKIMSNLTINLLFAPDISCGEMFSAVIGQSLTINCNLFVNPAADTFSLQLPSGEIIDGATVSNVKFSVIPAKVENVEWMYHFMVTYQKFTSDMLGQHMVSVTNKYGESTSTFFVKGGASSMELSYFTLSLLLVLKLVQDN